MLGKLTAAPAGILLWAMPGRALYGKGDQVLVPDFMHIWPLSIVPARLSRRSHRTNHGLSTSNDRYYDIFLMTCSTAAIIALLGGRYGHVCPYEDFAERRRIYLA